jgi:3'DNA-binding domain (3'BD)
MYHYAVLTEKLLPISFLTYSSDQDLAIGQLVEVPIRNSLEKGVIFKKSRVGQDSGLGRLDSNEPQELPNDIALISKYEIKPIGNVLPYIFSSYLMNFWQSVAFNNFASLNRVLSAALESFNLLIKADWKIITENYNLRKTTINLELNEPENNLSKNLPKPNKIGKTEYLTSHTQNSVNNSTVEDIQIILRIMYLIRNVEYKNTLIIFPEIKLLKKWLHKINLKEFSNINLYTFTSGKDKASKMAVKSLLLPDTKNLKKNVYFATRAGLFLPYNQISAIFVIDESNSMHIQEQGGLYFDVRETAYILASNFESDLYYQSNFPSVRFSDLAKI